MSVTEEERGVSVATGRLAGRVAVVTGAGQDWEGHRGRVADEGATVALLGRTPQKVVDVSKELIEKGHTALAIGCDVSDRDAVNGAVAETLAAFGQIDIVINNAQGGALGIDRPTVDLSDDDVLECSAPGRWERCTSCRPLFGATRIRSLSCHQSWFRHRGSGWLTPGRLRNGQGGDRRVDQVDSHRREDGIRVNQVCPAAWSPGRGIPRRKPCALAASPAAAFRCAALVHLDGDIGRAMSPWSVTTCTTLSGVTIMLDGGQATLRLRLLDAQLL